VRSKETFTIPKKVLRDRVSILIGKRLKYNKKELLILSSHVIIELTADVRRVKIF